MNGRIQRAQRSRRLNFDLRAPDAPPLSELDWESQPSLTLRLELQHLLICAELCPLDLCALLRGMNAVCGRVLFYLC